MRKVTLVHLLTAFVVLLGVAKAHQVLTTSSTDSHCGDYGPWILDQNGKIVGRYPNLPCPPATTPAPTPDKVGKDSQ
jgi:hypothetical protein